MYIEQEMYTTNGEVSKLILMQKYNSEDVFISNLGPCSFKVIGLSNSHIQASVIILTIKFVISIIHI